MKKTIFNNQFGTFTVAVPDQYLQAFERNDPAPNQSVKIYWAPPRFAQEGVFTRLMWKDRETEMAKPLSDTVLYLMDLAVANWKEIVTDKGFGNDVYVIITAVAKKGYVNLRLRIIDENDILQCVWFASENELNMSESKMDKFIGVIMDATKESGMGMDINDEVDFHIYKPDNDYNVNQAGEQKNEKIVPPSPPTTETAANSTDNDGKPDDDKRHEQNNEEQLFEQKKGDDVIMGKNNDSNTTTNRRSYPTRRISGRPLEGQTGPKKIVNYNLREEKPQPKVERRIIHLPPFKWVDPGQTIPLYVGLEPPTQINDEQHYNSLVENVASLDARSGNLSVTEQGYLRRIRILIKEYQMQNHRLPTTYKINGRVFTFWDPSQQTELSVDESTAMKYKLISFVQKILSDDDDITNVQIEGFTKGQPLNKHSFYIKGSIETTLSPEEIAEIFADHHLFIIFSMEKKMLPEIPDKITDEDQYKTLLSIAEDLAQKGEKKLSDEEIAWISKVAPLLEAWEDKE